MKKTVAQMKRNKNKTGGGPPEKTELTWYEDQLHHILSEIVDGLTTEGDSDDRNMTQACRPIKEHMPIKENLHIEENDNEVQEDWQEVDNQAESVSIEVAEDGPGTSGIGQKVTQCKVNYTADSKVRDVHHKTDVCSARNGWLSSVVF
ncbi:uncharacterized protein LOC126891101 [Diabrotica virgifera virgifera]|uniref:Uncharacterized protein n=1 Tax=Diabrotica virgifera virgifera TaxID=50390 RepID=A0ABM5L1B4_DIAVI|nr:uncharacterized protein LOC126891101 [Diabrotica virgifera virgifera]